MKMLPALLIACASLCSASSNSLADPSSNLPKLGDTSSAIVSKQDEQALGQSFLRILNQQAPILEDPLVFNYLETLINKLVLVSPLLPKSFSLVVIKDPSFNAFAAPGHIIGIHSGLLLYADTEDELASVIAHEIGHLSQRHYARSLERQKSQRLISLASLLGGILVMATGQADAGFATLSAGQAIAINNQLKYSRLDEQEADRVGISTLYQAGFNPKAAASMFEHLQVMVRYQDNAKQYNFLSTHPLTESRISDALSQANGYPARRNLDRLDFHLIKARTKVLATRNAKLAISHFSGVTSLYPDADQYGLALAYLADNKANLAKPILAKLLKTHPYKTAFAVAYAECLTMQKAYKEAITFLKKQLKLSPDSLPLSYTLATVYQRQSQYDQAALTLENLIKKQASPPAYLYRELAEIEGLAGHIGRVHKARGDYFVMTGDFDDARKQIRLALPYFKTNRQITAQLKEKLLSIAELEKNNPLK